MKPVWQTPPTGTDWMTRLVSRGTRGAGSGGGAASTGPTAEAGHTLDHGRIMERRQPVRELVGHRVTEAERHRFEGGGAVVAHARLGQRCDLCCESLRFLP